MKPMIRVLAVGVLPAMILAACATLPKRVRQTPPTAPEPLGLSIGYDLSGLRIDLKRATHSVLRFIPEPDATVPRKLRPEYVSVANPYHPLVVAFGNGIIMDANGNLSLDLMRLYHLEEARRFRITERFNNLFPAGAIIAKKGNFFELRGTGIYVDHVTATTKGNVTAVDGGPGLRHARILEGTNWIAYQPSGRSDSRTASVTTSPAGIVTLHATSRSTDFRPTGNGQVRSSRGLEISRHDNQLDIVMRSPGGVEARITYVKTRTGCTITGLAGYGRLQVMREGDEVFVTEGGKLIRTVTIE